MGRQWDHARTDKVVINLDGGGWTGNGHVMCAWDTCTRQGYDSNRVTINDAAPGYPDKLIRYVFCSERHKFYFVHSHRDYGNLPPGYRMSTILWYPYP